MNDSSFNESDEILAAFLNELSKAPNAVAKRRIVSSYIMKHPQLENDFRGLSGIEMVLEKSQQPNAIPELPREFGEYLIVRRIGHDGMGEIYEAYHDRLDRRVAIKIIRRGWASDESKQRFTREQLVLAKLHQTHIVPIHTAGEHDGVQYFVMPYIEGASLNFVVHAAREYHSSNPGQDTPSVARFAESAVARSKTAETFKASVSDGKRGTAASADNHKTRTDEAAQPTPFEKEYHSSVARAMADVADAVGYAHAGGILHRDIKPHNIMIEPNGHVWVIDFGLAGFLQPKPESDDSNADGESEPKTVPSFDGNPQLTQGIGGGTSSHMAPERRDGRKENALSDVWALGATLYELLTLHRAFDGPSWEVIRKRIQAHTVKPPKELVSIGREISVGRLGRSG